MIIVNILWTKYQHKADIIWSFLKRNSDEESHTKTVRRDLLLIPDYHYIMVTFIVLSQYNISRKKNVCVLISYSFWAQTSR